MTGKRRKKDFEPHISADKAPMCQSPGCDQQGVYKAPVSRDKLSDYRWLCLDHIREHNSKWDYFEGMNEREIETFMREAVTGHRPTWTRESHIKDPGMKLEDALAQFMSASATSKRKASPRLPVKARRALDVMQMDFPYTQKELKTTYRAMVKKHHPDVNKGDKHSEERFKEITASYMYLTEQLKNM